MAARGQRGSPDDRRHTRERLSPRRPPSSPWLPGGAEKTLLAIPASAAARDVRETVKAGRFLEAAGDYRVELRAGGKVLASTTLTIASGFETAIVNACEPFAGPEKTGPGH